MEVSSESVNTSKKQCTDNVKPEPQSLVSQESLLNFPIPERHSKVCHLKVYDNCDSLKLNSICEFVGFLSVDPALATSAIDEEMNDVEFQVHNPPPSLIPRIHCVFFKDVKNYNPLITNAKVSFEKMQFLRKELLILFTQLLCGDDLAAEYLICHLISEV